MTNLKSLMLAAVSATVLAAAPGAWADAHLGPESGTITMNQFKIGFIVGYSGGGGTLMYEGKAHKFSVKGLRLGATGGIASTDLEGKVFNLERLEDFPGGYEAEQAAIAIIKGRKHYTLKNKKGVFLQLAGKQTGIEVALDVGGMTITLE